MAGSASGTAANSLFSGGAAGMASSIFPTLPASNMQPRFDINKIKNDFGDFDPSLPLGTQGQQFNDVFPTFPKSSNGGGITIV